jgi:hypothetical protein
MKDQLKHGSSLGMRPAWFSIRLFLTACLLMGSLSLVKADTGLLSYFFPQTKEQPAELKFLSEPTTLQHTVQLTYELWSSKKPVERYSESTVERLYRQAFLREGRTTVRPGFGQFFPGDIIGRSKTSGAGLEESKYVYVRFCFRF